MSDQGYRDYVSSGQQRQDELNAKDMNSRVEANKDRQFRTSAAGLGSHAKKMKGMPKQADYPDTKSWSEAMRKWRAAQESDSDVQAQKKFLTTKK